MKRLAFLLLLLHQPAFASPEEVKKAILMCESSNMHYEPKSSKYYIKGKKVVRYGDDGISRGIAQFRRETFYEQAAEAKREGVWPFERPRWFNKEQQLFLLDYMLDKGLGRRWTCYRKLYEFQPMD